MGDAKRHTAFFAQPHRVPAFIAARHGLLMMAGSLLTIIPVAIIFIVFQRFFVRGVASSGVKG